MDSVQFVTMICDSGQECPKYAVIKVTNVTDTEIQRNFGMTIWRGQFPDVGMGAAATLKPFQTKTVTVDFQPALNDNSTAMPGVPYSWQWYVTDPNR